MAAVELDKLTWPDVAAQIEAGRDTVVVAFGATEQHGHHLPLATDALLGDELARRVADELDAFVAPTVRVGCSSHHLAFAGTLSLRDETFAAIVADLVSSFAASGFRRAVLLPSHGGNFAPLGSAVAALPDDVGIEVAALTDVSVLLTIAELGAEAHGVPLGDGGLHGGEWETAMMLVIAPELVAMDRAVAGYTGDPEQAIAGLFVAGVDSVSETGVIGDPTQASAAHGEAYWQRAVDAVIAAIG